MGILDLLATGQIGGINGSAGTATLPDGAVCIGASAVCTAAGSVTITPHGANQTGTAMTITIPAGTAWTLPLLAGLGQIGGNSTLVFATTDSYSVMWVKPKIGA